MNIIRKNIVDWVESRSERIAKHIELKGDQSMHYAVGEMIDQCLNDLAPKWVSVDEVCAGSKWIHCLGEKYEVITIANKETTTDRYPVTVIYKNMSNGIIWSRSLSDWHRSMKPLPEPPK